MTTTETALAPGQVLGVDRSGWSVAQRQAEFLAVRRFVDRMRGVEAELLAGLTAQAAAEQTDGLVQVDGQWATVASWLAGEERVHVNSAAAQVHQARRLGELPLVRGAVQGGRIRPAHADVLQGLVGKLDPAHLAAAEPVLVAMAEEYDPTALRGRVRAWLAEHYPDVFAAEEDRAADAGWVQLDPQSNGRHKLHGYPPSGQCEALLTALASLTPRADEQDRRPLRQRRADALLELASRCAKPDALPDVGGLPAQDSLVVTCDPVTGRPPPVGMAPHTGPVAPWLTSLWTCDAELTPIALRLDGQVLALGRTNRVVNRAQRRALNARDGGCVARGCTQSPGACNAHHLIHWADGGSTDLDNLVLLCRHHHRQWHRGKLGLYQLKIPWLSPPEHAA